MQPRDIGPHPDAPAHYFPMGKPKDWNEEDCGTLTVRRVGATGDMLAEPAARLVQNPLPSGEVIYPSFLMEWEPTPEERARMLSILMNDWPFVIRQLIAGNGLPPTALWLRAEDEV